LCRLILPVGVEKRLQAFLVSPWLSSFFILGSKTFLANNQHSINKSAEAEATAVEKFTEKKEFHANYSNESESSTINTAPK
jgi:thiamine biosynthesis lipoprotein ApbE